MNKPTKILITEDEMIVALDLERRLKKLGYDCVLAPSGEQAIAVAAAQRPDVVLMDICLQGDMDGIAAAERIRIHNDIPIIFLTANADERTLQRAEITHPASYLLKPYKERELHICIEMALTNHALQTELRTARDEMERNVIARTTELLKANDALRKEIRLHQEAVAMVREQAALLDKARDAIFVRDLAGQILYWNAGAERLYGFTKVEAVGQSVSALLNQNHEIETKALECTQRDGEWMGELINISKSGAERPVESRWTFMPDKAAVLVVETDVSERKKIEAQFLRVQRLESVGALASGIAHDLNNVFTPLIMTAQLMSEDAIDPKARQLADIVMTSARHGSDMVKQVLLFVRGGEGENFPFRLEHLVKDTVNLLRDTFPKNIRIRSNYTPDLWSVIGDATRLHQVLMNLCVNARDAMPTGGNLSITMKNFLVEDSATPPADGIRPGRYIRLDVADTGTGMTPEVKQKVFDPFFTTKAPGKGTGLGLATVLTIIKGHEGFLKFESEPGVGTCFHIYLPACDEVEAATRTPFAPPPTGRGELILIADDEHTVREIVKSILEASGYRTILADDGATALSQFALNREEIACVIADIEMPNLDGFACAQAFRLINKNVPVLLATGKNEPEPPADQIEAAGAAYLAKPFTKAELLTNINRCIESARLKKGK
ncbi:MAG: response regulator [Nibricoccus sp.]